jgi:hypothetical protein
LETMTKHESPNAEGSSNHLMTKKISDIIIHWSLVIRLRH